MKKKFTYLAIVAVISIICGCKKFLEVQPQDKYTEEQVFSNENAIQQNLNGIYTNLTSSTLYGGQLTTIAIELMAQRYNTAAYNAGTGLQLFQQYNYTDATTSSMLNNIWTAAYSNILQTNKFIAGIDAANQKGVISTKNATQLKGEAIAIRAMLHFDMLRLFGPVFKTLPNSPAIPYYTLADAKPRPILTAKQAMDSILNDLGTSKILLSGDPVITGGVNLSSSDFYKGHRNQRLNYYAVIALQARAYLYVGDKVNANAAAKLAITEVDKWFPWLPFPAIVNNANPDRIFSPEVLFGPYNQTLYLNYNTYFSSTLQNSQLLTAFPGRLASTFESNQNDYRYPSTWIAGGTGQTFNKFADLTDQTKPWRFLQPLIRKSELYYILAETEPITANGLAYLNTVRNNRGLINLQPAAVLTAELQKEYQKEFWGEGQLFFYYKRNATTPLPNALNANGTIVPLYVVPLPLSETSPR
jgi:hypothetical protein